MLIKAGEIIKNSWGIYFRNFKKLLPYMLAILAPNIILALSGLFSLYLLKYTPDGFFMVLNNIVILIIIAAALVFTLWTAMAAIRCVRNLATGQPAATWKENMSATSRLIWPFIYTSLLVGLVVLGGTVLLIIPGIIFSIWYCFTTYAVILDDKKGREAMRASKALVTGRWWSILWRLLAPGLFFALVTILVNFVLSYLCLLAFGNNASAMQVANGAVSGIVNALAAPLTALVVVILYLDAKAKPVETTPTMIS